MQKPRTIAIVEDDDAAARLMESVLSKNYGGGFSTVHVRTLKEAVRLLYEKPLDVIILDLGLPDSQDLSSIKALQIASPNSAIVVLTSHNDEDDADRAIEHGAQAYIVKQEKISHLMPKIVRHAFIRQQQKLKAQMEALTDALTAIPNRRALDVELARRAADFTRHEQPFSLMIFDIDWFKKINDQYGHFTGDDALINVAKILQQQIRCADLAARYGGEEFALVVSMTKLEQAFELASRIRRTIELYFKQHDCRCPPLTVSGGVAEFRSGDDIATLIKRADAALYEAKQHGRNQCAANHGTWFTSDRDQEIEVDLRHSLVQLDCVRELARW